MFFNGNRRVALISVFSCVFFAWSGKSVSALTNLTNIETSRDQVTIAFDRQVKSDQIKKEFFRNIVQISFKDVTVYPAKVIPSDGTKIQKIFAYQYTPKVVRCRLTVNGNAEDLKDNFSVKVDGEKVSLAFVSGKTSVASAAKDELNLSNAKAVAPTADESDQDLLKEVIDDSSSPAKAVVKADPLRAFWWLGGFFAVVGGFVLFVWRLFKSGKKPAANRKKGTGISDFVRKLGPAFGATSGESIEIVATKYLGPRKSIVIIQIDRRRLVLGVTQDSIRLITQYDAADGTYTENTEANTENEFDSVLSDRSDAEPSLKIQSLPKNPELSGMREKIRKRMEAMKQL